MTARVFLFLIALTQAGCIAALHRGYPATTVRLRIAIDEPATAVRFAGIAGSAVPLRSDGRVTIAVDPVSKKCVWRVMGIPMGSPPKPHVLEVVSDQGSILARIRIDDVATLATDARGYHILAP